MNLVTGALGNLALKLPQLLHDEYKLQKGVKARVESLACDLESMQRALCKVAEVPHVELDSQVKQWARELREASYDMEDALDKFLVRVDGDGNQTADADKARVKHLRKKMGKLFSKIKARREIACTIEDIKKRIDEITLRRDRYNYKVDDRRANNSATTSIDPYLLTSHTKASEFVGIDEPRDALIKELSRVDDDASDKDMKVVSIFGSGGLGKTTLARVVYDKLAIDMNIYCKAFIPVGQKPDLKKVFRDILLELNKEHYLTINLGTLDKRQLIDEIHNFLKDKRYIIVIDDIWEVVSWMSINIALEDNKLGSKIIITTRCSDVAHAKQVHYSYKLMSLLPESSEILFYGRVFGSKERCPEKFAELSQKFLKKCGGVPLAIITLSSLLADKLEDITTWEGLCDAIGSGLSSDDDGVRTMRKILSLSYYDLSFQLKTCFLYLCMYPEDYLIPRDQLIWMWIAEGFIERRTCRDDLFEIGETYFNKLINRSLVEPVGCMDDSGKGIHGCRVHDMILDLIHSLSREENFITTSEQVIDSKTKQIQIRRLFINNTTFPKADMSRVRSIAIFNPSIDSISFLSSFGALRVLALEGCYLEDMRLNVGKLIHLRYLNLQSLCLKEPPEGRGKLQFLKVLNLGNLQYLQVLKMDVSSWLFCSLQPIFCLRRLMCIEGIPCHPRSRNLLRNLASLQVLQYLSVHEDSDSVGIVEELGHLTKLKELCISFLVLMSQGIGDALICSLGKLRRLQKLEISHHIGLSSGKNSPYSWENWMPPPDLRTLKMFMYDSTLQTLPKWINRTSLPHLTELDLNRVNIVRPEDIQILGELPSLCILSLWGGTDSFEGPWQKFVLRAGAFPRLIECRFVHVVTVPSMFPRGAMPGVERLEFWLRTRDFFSNDGPDFSDLAMEQFPSLQKASFDIYGEDDEEVKKIKEALKRAADVHPNRPSIFCFRRFHHCHEEER